MKTKTILLVGFGNIGKRYLEGILELRYNLKIYLIDININALDKAKLISKNKFEKNLSNKEIIAKSTINEVKEESIDLSILTTTADVRFELINSIVKKFNVRSWILEKVLAQSENQVFKINNLIGDKSSCWVNTPRRAMKWYADIKKKLLNLKKSPLKFEVSGGNWGLACNAVHFLDLVSWITDSEICELKVINNKIWENSKRKNFKELFGRIKVKYSDNSNLIMTCDNTKTTRNISVMINNDYWLIDELNGLATGPNNQIIKGRLEYQSNIITEIINDIFHKKTCSLTSLEESSKQHIYLLNELLINFNKTNKQNFKILPIT
tara:strand:- start:986 stop:1954 length:969 start_codon:yes stop_codon:yes gene_type:complete